MAIIDCYHKLDPKVQQGSLSNQFLPSHNPFESQGSLWKQKLQAHVQLIIWKEPGRWTYWTHYWPTKANLTAQAYIQKVTVHKSCQPNLGMSWPPCQWLLAINWPPSPVFSCSQHISGPFTHCQQYQHLADPQLLFSAFSSIWPDPLLVRKCPSDTNKRLHIFLIINKKKLSQIVHKGK